MELIFYLQHDGIVPESTFDISFYASEAVGGIGHTDHLIDTHIEDYFATGWEDIKSSLKREM